MKGRLIGVAALSLMLMSNAYAWNDILNSVWGPKGNDTGGIIPWSPENEKNAFEIAANNCKIWNKYPVATSLRRQPGDYIVYKCVWDAPGAPRHRSHRVDVKIEK